MQTEVYKYCHSCKELTTGCVHAQTQVQPSGVVLRQHDSAMARLSPRFREAAHHMAAVRDMTAIQYSDPDTYSETLNRRMQGYERDER